MGFTTWMQASPSWKVVPTSVIFGERSEKSTDEDVHLTPSQKLGVIPQDEYIEKTGAQVVKNRLGSDNMKRVKPGDFISHLRSFQGGLEHTTIPGKVSNAYTVLRPRRQIEGKYYSYLFKSASFIEGLANLTDQLRDGQTINFARLALFSLPLPPLSTQRAIADYLDRETAEIDGMRADLDEMERLLTERRAAVISETMLHLAEEYPNVQVGTLVKLVSGSGFPHKYQGQVGEELPFYKVGSMSLVDRQGFIRDDRNTISTEEAHQLAAHIIPENSVLMAKIGAALLLGRFVRNSISCCIDNNMLALIPSNNVDSSFLMLSLSLVDIELLERPGPVPTLDLTGLRQSRIPLPPLAEQRRIADEIDRETAEIDSMLEDITKLRDLLAERRAAVISAAVTGQIDIPVSPTDKDEPHV
ncbi:restriction endonuclease subunit S [Corynebacterium striatum]|uniref:restriction endonuclease subunit S n=1 Tax=Corynebacterium striatum TaxID=43770 RepID=UPI0034D45F7E